MEGSYMFERGLDGFDAKLEPKCHSYGGRLESWDGAFLAEKARRSSRQTASPFSEKFQF